MTTQTFSDAPGYIREAYLSGPKIVAIGGGTGLSTMLHGLKNVTANLTAIVAVSDDGGSSGYLRYDRDMPPPGDIRHCIMALANSESYMEKVMEYRFKEGPLHKHSFGNLFLAALTEVLGSFEEAVMRMQEALNVRGRVLPVTTSNVYLEAEFTNGAKVLGESRIFKAKKEEKCRIKRVNLVPDNPGPLPAVIQAIAEADMIILGPGSLYTSIIPNLLVPGVSESVANARAMKVYVCNVMTQEGETEGYTASDHLKELIKHSHAKIADFCLVNDAHVPPEILERYERENAWPLEADGDDLENLGVEIVRRPLLGKQKNFARHNPERLALELFKLFYERGAREGAEHDMDKCLLGWLEARITENFQ